VFGLYGGVLADRFDRRALLRWCEVGLGCCAVLLLVNALLAKPSVALLFVLVAATMAVSSLQRPSLDASFARLVPRQQLTAASAIMSLSQNIGFLVGTSLGGVLAVTPGPWLVYAVDAGGFAVSFCFLTRLQPLPRQASGDSGSGSDSVRGGRAALREIAAGLRYAIGRRDLLGSYAADLSAMIFAYPAAMFPFMAVVLHAPWSRRPDVRRPVSRRDPGERPERLDGAGTAARPGHRPGRCRMGGGDHRLRPGA
jgi:MFS family permease